MNAEVASGVFRAAYFLRSDVLRSQKMNSLFVAICVIQFISVRENSIAATRDKQGG